MARSKRATPDGQLEHPALLYADLDEFLGFMAPFVADGLDRGEPVFVAVGPEELTALRTRVGARAQGGGWVDTQEWHPNPATRLRAFYEFVMDKLSGGATKVRLVGEPLWPPGRPEFVLEWERYESVLNEVLGPYPVTLVCTYDTSRLDPSIVANARRTHPIIHQGMERASSEFEEPAELLRRWNAELSPPPTRASQIQRPVDLAGVRGFLMKQALRAGLQKDRAMDVCIAVNEVVTNALMHTGGALALRTWAEDGYFICQVEDGGGGFADSLAGYRPPTGATDSGRGLWLARQLVDLLQIVPGASGTTIRLHMSRT